MTTQNEERDVFQSHCFESFPEPQTIPAGWDLSEMLAPSKTVEMSCADEEDKDVSM